ncbi:flagellar basal body protein, partial [Sulfitobacter sp. HI0040]
MTEASYLGMSLAASLQRQLDVTSNNIANANTAGYKGEHVVFETFVQQNAGADQDPANFVRDRGSYVDMRP